MINHKNGKHSSIQKKLFVLLLLVYWFPACLSMVYTQSGRGVYHTVQPGQTLYRIAETYDLDINKLQRFNNITNSNDIQAGLRLWIPNSTRVLPVPKTQNKTNGWSTSLTKKKKITSRKKKSGRKKAFRGFFDWPLKGGTLTSKFGNRRGHHHDGIDIAARTGTAVHAAAKGKVVFSGNGPKGYGSMVIIKHSNGLMTVYAHNSVNHVGRSMKVRKGQRIALVGSTGRSTGPHLHFEIRDNTNPVNPLLYLAPPEVVKVARGIR